MPGLSSFMILLLSSPSMCLSLSGLLLSSPMRLSGLTLTRLWVLLSSVYLWMLLALPERLLSSSMRLSLSGLLLSSPMRLRMLLALPERLLSSSRVLLLSSSRLLLASSPRLLLVSSSRLLLVLLALPERLLSSSRVLVLPSSRLLLVSSPRLPCLRAAVRNPWGCARDQVTLIRLYSRHSHYPLRVGPGIQMSLHVGCLIVPGHAACIHSRIGR